MHTRGVVPLAFAALLLVASGCGGGGGDTESPLAEGEDLVLAESEAPIRPAIELGDRDPASVLSGDGLVFGVAGTKALLATEGFASDPLVEQSMAREVYASESGKHLATLTTLTLAPGVFTSEVAVDGYVRGLASAVSGAGETPVAVELGTVDGFSASGEQRSAVTFRLDNVVVLVDAPTADGVGRVAAAVADSATSQSATEATSATPFADIDPASVFTDLNGFEFMDFPTEDERVNLAYEPLPVPLLEGLGLAQARLVVIGNEIRGAAWALPASRDVYGSGEDLIEPMRGLATLRSGGETSEEVVVGRTVYAADGSESVRVFRNENLVLVVDGIDPLNADAITSEWARSIGSP